MAVCIRQIREHLPGAICRLREPRRSAPCPRCRWADGGPCGVAGDRPLHQTRDPPCRRIERIFREADAVRELRRYLHPGQLRPAIQAHLTAISLNLKSTEKLQTGVSLKGRARAVAWSSRDLCQRSPRKHQHPEQDPARAPGGATRSTPRQFCCTDNSPQVISTFPQPGFGQPPSALSRHRQYAVEYPAYLQT
jgi:hypothetical protein